ncbi:MAG: preprotein translocase subunit YajC [Planctomycetes bacterium]|nr:preprotein translocase subunit YajC [Planctomycetota bacterium]
MNNYWLIAQAQAPAGDEGTIVKSEPVAPAADTITTSTQAPGTPTGTDKPLPTGKNPKEAMWSQMLLLGLLFVLMYFMLFRAPRKRQQEQQKMVSSLKKNDRVITTGGILGTILDVRDDEIVLKIDEATNTKMRVVPSAILKVLGDDKKNQ